jgi:hypothetical protein
MDILNNDIPGSFSEVNFTTSLFNVPLFIVVPPGSYTTVLSSSGSFQMLMSHISCSPEEKRLNHEWNQWVNIIIYDMIFINILVNKNPWNYVCQLKPNQVHKEVQSEPNYYLYPFVWDSCLLWEKHMNWIELNWIKWKQRIKKNRFESNHFWRGIVLVYIYT